MLYDTGKSSLTASQPCDSRQDVRNCKRIVAARQYERPLTCERTHEETAKEMQKSRELRHFSPFYLSQCSARLPGADTEWLGK